MSVQCYGEKTVICNNRCWNNWNKKKNKTIKHLKEKKKEYIHRLGLNKDLPRRKRILMIEKNIDKLDFIKSKAFEY